MGIFAACPWGNGFPIHLYCLSYGMRYVSILLTHDEWLFAWFFQGDESAQTRGSLTSYLFILCLVYFSRLLRKETNGINFNYHPKCAQIWRSLIWLSRMTWCSWLVEIPFWSEFLWIVYMILGQNLAYSIIFLNHVFTQHQSLGRILMRFRGW